MTFRDQRGLDRPKWVAFPSPLLRRGTGASARRRDPGAPLTFPDCAGREGARLCPASPAGRSGGARGEPAGMCSGTRAPRLQLKERGGACAGAGRGGGHPARAGSPGFWNIDGSGRPGGRRPGFVLLPRPLSGAAGALSLAMPTGAGRPGGGSAPRAAGWRSGPSVSREPLPRRHWKIWLYARRLPALGETRERALWPACTVLGKTPSL